MIASLTKYLSFLPGLWKHRRIAMIATLLTGLIGAIIVMMLPNRYEASARAYVDTQTILRPLMEGMAVQPDVSQQLSMMSRALLSRANLQITGKAAGLLDGTQTAASEEASLDELRDKIQFEPAGRQNFFSLKFRDPNPEVALSVVTTLLDLFFNSARSNQERDTEQALAFLDDQIQQYEKRLETAETALKEFKINNLEVMPNLQQDYFAQTAGVQERLDSAQLELQQTLNARAALQAQLQGVPESFSSADPRAGPGVMSDTERRLTEAQARLGDLRMRYTERHPDVQNTARMVKDLESAYTREKQAIAQNGGVAPGNIVIPNRVFQELKVSLASTDAQVASLRARVADARRRLDSVRLLAKTVPEVEAKYKQLNRDYEVNKDNYEKLVSRRESALLSGNLDATSGAGDFRVVDPPKVSTAPVWPNRPVLLILICLGSLVVGLFTALLRSQSSPAFFDVYSLRAATDVPVFGSVSLVSDGVGSVIKGLGSASFWIALMAYFAAFAVAIVFTIIHQSKKEPTEPALSGRVGQVERYSQTHQMKHQLPSTLTPATQTASGNPTSPPNRAL